MPQAESGITDTSKLSFSPFDLSSLHDDGRRASLVGREHGNTIVANNSTTATPHGGGHQSAAIGQAGAGYSPVGGIVKGIGSVMNGGSGGGGIAGQVKLIDDRGGNGGGRPTNSDMSLAASPRRPWM